MTGSLAPNLAIGALRILDGCRLAHAGRLSTAGQVVVRHLAQLGAHVTHTEPGASQRWGEWVRLTSPAGSRFGSLDLTWQLTRTEELRSADGGEQLVQAACGLMHVHGRKHGAPRSLPLPYAHAVAGVVGVQSVLAALIANVRGPHKVSRVVTSLEHALLFALSQYIADATTAGYRLPHLEGTSPPPFTSRDGVRFEMEILDPEIWRSFWTELQADTKSMDRGWRAFLMRYATACAPIPLELHEILRQRSWPELTALAARTGVSVCQVRRWDDVPHEALLAEPQAPWAISESTAVLARSPRPRTGEAPLEGISVLEATRRIQGPLASRVLRLLGARVIRIEPPGGDPLRGMPPTADGCSARYLALNANKDVIELDIKSAKDRARAHSLARESDVFLHNFAPGKAAGHGLSAADLQPLGLPVYAEASAWGPNASPSRPLGTDFMVQAESGLAALVEGPCAEPSPSLVTLLDVLGGLISAEGITAALLAHATQGTQCISHSSLSSAAELLLTASAGLPERRTETSANPVKTSRGWVALESTPAAGPASGREIPVTEDLSELVTNPLFEPLFQRAGCALVIPPWRLEP